MSLRHVCFGAALLFTSSSVAAENWIEITHNFTGSTYHYDSDTKKTEGNTLQVWIMGDHSKDKTITERTSKMLMLIDCENETITMQASYTFSADGRMLKGGSFKKHEQDAEPVIPGSIGGWIFEALCKAGE